MSGLIFLSREADRDGKKEWKCGHVKVLDGKGEIIAYLADNQALATGVASVICDMLKLDWANDTEIETFGVAFEVAPVIGGDDVAAIVITYKGEIQTWGF